MDDTYLKPGRLIESEDPAVVAFAKKAVGDESDEKQKALKLFYAVRDAVSVGRFRRDLEQGWAVSSRRSLRTAPRG